MAWVLAVPGVTGAIVGARRPEQVDSWLAAASLELTGEDLDDIEGAIEETGAGTAELAHASGCEPGASGRRARSPVGLSPAMPDVDPRSARLASALGDGAAPIWVRAPGRVNLIGEHTDYNEGFVLPVAIDRDCLVAARPRADGRMVVRSLDIDPAEGVVELAADGSDDPALVEPAWGRYVAGVVQELAALGRAPVGVDAVLSSTVPLGSGLSSSAALEVACAVALCTLAGLDLVKAELAAACQRAEQVATGVPCGIMDQLCSLAGVADAALLIDCRSLEIQPVRLPPEIQMLAVHCGLPRALADSEYAERRAACEAAARALGLQALRDAALEDVATDPFARHVVSENARVLETVAALEEGDLGALGPLFAASHASLRDDFRVSTPELDALVQALVEAGALGARLTGAGFGGCVVALTRSAEADAVAAEASESYRAATGLDPTVFACQAVVGAAAALERAVGDGLAVTALARAGDRVADLCGSVAVLERRAVRSHLALAGDGFQEMV